MMTLLEYQDYIAVMLTIQCLILLAELAILVFILKKLRMLK